MSEKEQVENVSMGIGLSLANAGANTAKVAMTPLVGIGLLAAGTYDAIGSMGIMSEIAMERAVGGRDEPQYEEHPGEMQVDVFDIEDADWKRLRQQYIDEGIPFVLKHKDPATKISDATPPAASSEVLPEAQNTIHVVPDKMSAKFSGIDAIVKKLLPFTWRAYWPLWFTGNYKSGVAHVDVGPATVNFYYMQAGHKDTVIVPLEETRKLALKTGIDNLFIPGSAGNHEYLKNVGKYWRLKVQPNSILIFNNSGSLHHFTNIVEDGISPVALSVRCKHAIGSDPRGWLSLAANFKTWWNMTDHLVTFVTKGQDDRPAEKA